MEQKTTKPSTPSKNPTPTKPNHYKRKGALECWDEMEMLFGIDELMTFCKLNIFKYRYRAYDKNGFEDLQKSDVYSQKYKELLEKKEAMKKHDNQRTRNQA